MKYLKSALVFSPSDLVTYLNSPFASWMDRFHLENPGVLTPDEESDDMKLIAQTGTDHETAVLTELLESGTETALMVTTDPVTAFRETLEAFAAKTPVVYQARLEGGGFAGFADFVMLGADGRYQIWDTKLARSPKPYYAIQLCCYSEMFAASTGLPMPEKFGVILGSNERVEFRTENFIHYYRRVKADFLKLHEAFDGDFARRPEPSARAGHGRWQSHADALLDAVDHLARVAGISSGQIKKLAAAGITTLAQLAAVDAATRVPKVADETLAKLVAQARLQHLTRLDRLKDPETPARYEIISAPDALAPEGLASLPPADPADVFFDMEGYPLMPGGLEYLFGATTIGSGGEFEFTDFWAHDRDEEKVAFENFVDWVCARRKANRGMHIYHYAAYEVSAMRRLSTRHDTRQDEVDDLLRNEVFVDLYNVVRKGIRIGESSYSIKKVELLYRSKRGTEVANATDSIVQYARFIESGEPRDWRRSAILSGIRDYNKDDCDSTAELLKWLRKLAETHAIAPSPRALPPSGDEVETERVFPDHVIERQRVAAALAGRADATSRTLAEIVDFHRRESKPIFWKLFDRAASPADVLFDDDACIADVSAVGEPEPVKRSLAQTYRFDPAQECRLSGRSSKVYFAHELGAKFEVLDLDQRAGTVTLKLSKDKLDKHFGGVFPPQGSLIPDEFVSPDPIPAALTDVASRHLDGRLPAAARALLERIPPNAEMRRTGEDVIDAAIRVTGGMDGGSLVIQGPPGTGKTYTASHVIRNLLAQGKTVGITSNSHKAINNLIRACGSVLREAGETLVGVRAGGDGDDELFEQNPSLVYLSSGSGAFERFAGGIVGGTAWLFTKDEWEGALDYLFVDEAGQISLANAVAMTRCATNLVLLGDQMQLEQPIQGSHPGDAGLSALQFALKDAAASKPDLPVFHAVVPPDYGLFLGQSRRMHPAVCRLISESIYDGRLDSHESCALQRIEPVRDGLIALENGVRFLGVEHDGNTQRSDEEVEKACAVLEELLGRSYTDSNGATKPLGLQDFLFIAPYNAQVAALQSRLPDGARVGSVDRFQGQEAPVCVLTLCSSPGEYGSRGLGFILDRNRLNVAISRAKCLAVVIADPRIATTPAATLAEMELINLFCKLTADALPQCEPADESDQRPR